MGYVLSIDLGTTGNKALLIDQDANVVASAYEEFQQYYPENAWVEHDALEDLEYHKKCDPKGVIKN